jgi:fumarate reductase subunit D
MDLKPIKCPFGIFCPKDASAQPVEIIFTRIIGFLTIVAGLTFLIYFMIGALNWITGGDDKGKVDAAKKYMTNGAIGMIAIVASYAIVWIVGMVLGLDILNPAKVLQQLTPGGSTP